MKKTSLLFAIAAMFFTTANAQMSDVTAQYISNSGFEECAIATTIDGVVQLVANDKNPVDYADKGWTFKEGYDGSSSFNAGVAEYPIKVKYSKWLAGRRYTRLHARNTGMAETLCVESISGLAADTGIFDAGSKPA